jgi:hypothetical protein
LALEFRDGAVHVFDRAMRHVRTALDVIGPCRAVGRVPFDGLTRFSFDVGAENPWQH